MAPTRGTREGPPAAARPYGDASSPPRATSVTSDGSRMSVVSPYPVHAWARILPTVLLSLFCSATVLVELPSLQNKFFGKHAFTVLGISSGVQGVLMFLCSPSVGAASDVVGRKWIALASAVAFALPFASLVVTTNMWVYQILTGVCGVLNTNLAFSYAYISDVTEPHQRARAYGWTQAMVGIAYFAGPLAATQVLKIGSRETVFYVALAFFVAMVLYTTFLLPETIQYARARAQSARRSRSRSSAGVAAFNRRLKGEPEPSGVCGGCCGGTTDGTSDEDEGTPQSRAAVLRRINPFRVLGALATSRLLRMLSVVSFLASLSENAVIVLVIPYVQHRFNFTPDDVALLSAALGIAMFFSSGWLFRPLVVRLGPKRMVLLSLFLSAVHITIYAVAWEGWMAYAAIVLAPAAFFVAPALAYIVSRVVPKDEQGAMQGALQAVRALSNGLGPALFGVLLNVTVYSGDLPLVWHGSAFLVGTAFVLVAMAVTMCLPPIVPCEDDAVGVAGGEDKGSTGYVASGGFQGDTGYSDGDPESATALLSGTRGVARRDMARDSVMEPPP